MATESCAVWTGDDWNVPSVNPDCEIADQFELSCAVGSPLALSELLRITLSTSGNLTMHFCEVIGFLQIVGDGVLFLEHVTIRGSLDLGALKAARFRHLLVEGSGTAAGPATKEKEMKLVVVLLLGCVICAFVYVVHNPKGACARIYDVSLASEDEKTLAGANKRIEDLEKTISRLQSAGHVAAWQRELREAQTKLLLMEAEKFRLHAELKERPCDEGYKAGDSISFKDESGAWVNGTVVDRPICVTPAGAAPGATPECFSPTNGHAQEPSGNRSAAAAA
ncbi:hypothetical protein DIPPA_33301 [Diplonema papillatum]|nr:hypothetical protein DIPPA_33301 [Diplonema papillatum]